MALWQSILVAVGGNAALLLVLGFLGRSLLGQFLTKDIEGFKAALQADTAIAVEKLKADLQRTALEHEVRFSRLHEKRAEVLAELYKLLVAATWEADTLVRPFATFNGESVEQYRVAMKAISEYFRFFDQHRIYLTHDLCIALEGFAKKLQAPTITFGVYIQIENPTKQPISPTSRRQQAHQGFAGPPESRLTDWTGRAPRPRKDRWLKTVLRSVSQEWPERLWSQYPALLADGAAVRGRR